MSAIDSAQLHYLETVLGIRSVLVPEGAVLSTPEKSARQKLDVQMRGEIEHAKLIAIWARSSAASGEAEILAQKMVAAMKLSASEVLWIEWNLGEQTAETELPPEVLAVVQRQGPPVLIFGEATAESFIPVRVQLGRWIDYKGGRFLVTLPPETLLESAEKKKVAWAHLQSVMKAL